MADQAIVTLDLWRRNVGYLYVLLVDICAKRDDFPRLARFEPWVSPENSGVLAESAAMGGPMTARFTDQSIFKTFDRGLCGEREGWISIAELTGGSEQVAGMLVESEPVRKVMASIARIAPYKTAVLVG